jgi:hypothetical protein
MTYRGVYQDGVVILEGDVPLRNGDRVSVNPSKAKTRSRQKPKLRSGRSGAKPSKKVHPFIALAGIWKDRPDWKGKSTLEVVADLRKRPTTPPKRPRASRG